MTQPTHDASMLEDDETHPIPFVFHLDAIARFPDNRVRLAIVIASPLSADARGHERLITKLEGYLGFIASDQYRAEFGAASPELVTIEVQVHRDTDPYYFELLAKCHDWVRSSGASLEVEKI
jgi:hypothetical protein